MALYENLVRGIRKAVLASSIPLYLVACADVGPYRPDPALVKVTAEDRIAVAGGLRLVNDQASTATHKLSMRGVTVNYREFSQALVAALETGYRKLGVVIAATASKELRIKVKRVRLESQVMNFRGEIQLDVAMGGTQDIEFFQTTRSSHGSRFMRQNFPTKPLTAAFEDMVNEILGNARVRAYLER